MYLELINALLNRLPLNGHKAKIGGFLFAILELLKNIDPAWYSELPPSLDKASLILFAVGLLHKALKKKYESN